jgi:hypothetical protein
MEEKIKTQYSLLDRQKSIGLAIPEEVLVMYYRDDTNNELNYRTAVFYRNLITKLALIGVKKVYSNIYFYEFYDPLKKIRPFFQMNSNNLKYVEENTNKFENIHKILIKHKTFKRSDLFRKDFDLYKLFLNSYFIDLNQHIISKTENLFETEKAIEKEFNFNNSVLEDTLLQRLTADLLINIIVKPDIYKTNSKNFILPVKEFSNRIIAKCYNHL